MVEKSEKGMCKLLHHDNARPHTAYIVQEFLAKNKMAVVPHPPYSPDLDV
jgi:transposase